jgi:hypothetical protein
MAITKEQARKVRQAVNASDVSLSIPLDASTTVDTRILSIVAEKISWQSDGNLAGTIEFSADGVNFGNSTAIAANTLASFSTHLVRAVKITRSSGAGSLHLLAK